MCIYINIYIYIHIYVYDSLDMLHVYSHQQYSKYTSNWDIPRPPVVKGGNGKSAIDL